MSAVIKLLPTSPSHYPSLLNGVSKLPGPTQTARLRRWAIADLYFLIRYVLSRPDIEHDWLFARCREVQAAPNGFLDLWAREHYKSTIITFGLTIQAVLENPDTTVGIFSHTRPIAKGFLRQIKRELEGNDMLRRLFPDVLWEQPSRDAPKWSEDDGIIVQRKGNPKESTVEAWGLVDGQPTGKHFRLMVYDDVVTRESVTTPEMIAKVTEAWELSRNLTTQGGVSRYIGTRYHFNDTYKAIIDRGAAKPRVYPATLDGTVAGEPVLMSRELLDEKRRDMGPYTFGCQMLQDPKADETQGFKEAWLRILDKPHEGGGTNKYILVDPASEKKKENDYTAMWVWGLGPDQNLYCLDMIRDRLSLTQRADALFYLHRKWQPRGVGYEKYGMMADVEHIKDRQKRENYRFEIIELGGSQPKPDRIRRLVPLFEQGRVWLPPTLWKTNYEGVLVDLIQAFIEEEFKPFPVALHDDMLDAASRLMDEDMQILWPKSIPSEDERKRDRYAAKSASQGSWMTQ